MAAHSILQPDQIEAAVGSIPQLYLPPEDLFIRRSRRFQQLATGHALADYLLFLAQLTAWQQTELAGQPALPFPDPHLLDRCRENAMPPLAPTGWPPHPSWREAAQRAIAATDQSLPQKGRQALSPLRDGDTKWLDRQAEILLQGHGAEPDLAAAPFIGAALQVQWAYWARNLRLNQIGRSAFSAICPVCGSPPVASIIHATGSSRGLRYMHCLLCGSEWHVVRAKCSQCENTKEIGYYGLTNSHKAIRAEACPQCCCYLKILFRELDIDIDPVADDIATLDLDMLLTKEKEYINTGINFFML